MNHFLKYLSRAHLWLLHVPFKESDMTRVLLSVRAAAGLPTSDWCRVIAAPGSMPLHGGSAAAPGAPAAPVTVHLLCICAQLETTKEPQIADTAFDCSQVHLWVLASRGRESNSTVLGCMTQQLSSSSESGAASVLLSYLR